MKQGKYILTVTRSAQGVNQVKSEIAKYLGTNPTLEGDPGDKDPGVVSPEAMEVCSVVTVGEVPIRCAPPPKGNTGPAFSFAASSSFK